MKNSSSRASAAIFGVAFVWFTTQFGGGFASGRQIIDFFLAYGPLALITPILSQGAMAILLTYVLRTAYVQHLESYNQFTDHFYGKARVVMTPLFEVIYNITMVLATAVAFATGGATITQLTGMPYILSSLLVGVFIFVLTVFGAELVRRTATLVSILIVVGMLVVYVPGILESLPQLGAHIDTLSTHATSPYPALWKMVLYTACQTVAIGAYIVHARAFHSAKDVAKSMAIGFVVNSVMMMLVVLGMISAIHAPELFKESVPVLVVIQNSRYAQILLPIVSLLILLGAVSTGVNFVYGAVDRVGKRLAHRHGSAFVSLVYTLICFACAQLGLIPLVSKGYSYVGITSLVVLVLPMLARMLMRK